MRILLTSLILLFVSFQSQAKEKPQISEYLLIYDSVDMQLAPGSATFIFDLRYMPLPLSKELLYSMDDGETQALRLDSTRELTINTLAGNHSFQFYLDEDHHEIYINYMPIASQHKKAFQINFRESYELQLMKKPVIYLYPEDTMQVEVEVIPKGEFTFTYPDIKNGWNFTCTPEGDILDGEKSYPYLFWESAQRIEQKDINPNAGALVKGKEAVAYLNAQLTQFGLTSSERADFITFWGPQLQTKTNLYIYLLLDEECDAFASLKISPQPQNTSRIYVIWSEVPANYSRPLESQNIPTMNREGFTVIEWGGAQVDASILFSEDL